MVKDWQDAVVVLIPKKGDLKQCDHWRGISLLDVVGKVLGRIVQGRLQAIAEKILPESQIGFRKDVVVQTRFLLLESLCRSEGTRGFIVCVVCRFEEGL